MAAARARRINSASRFKSPIFRVGKPLCAVPSTSPGPRNSQSASATSNPFVVRSKTASFAATDPAPKLVQLRETESLGVFNQHNSCIRHIDADLEHGRADQRVGVAAPKPIHDVLLFRCRNPAMK